MGSGGGGEMETAVLKQFLWCLQTKKLNLSTF